MPMVSDSCWKLFPVMVSNYCDMHDGRNKPRVHCLTTVSLPYNLCLMSLRGLVVWEALLDAIEMRR